MRFKRCDTAAEPFLVEIGNTMCPARRTAAEVIMYVTESAKANEYELSFDDDRREVNHTGVGEDGYGAPFSAPHQG